MISYFQIALAIVTIASINASKCPDITTQRSDFVKNKYDPALLTGLWYEHMYIDIAQLGASCERLNATYDATTGVITSDFEVKYGEIPFAITEVYTPPKNDSMKRSLLTIILSIPIKYSVLIYIKTTDAKAVIIKPL